MAKTASVTAGKQVRIVDINDQKMKFPRRYLDRHGEVQKVSNKHGVALVKFKNRNTPIEIPLTNLEVVTGGTFGVPTI